MKGLLCHALIVTAVLFGGDLRFNEGRETYALFAAMRAGAIAGGAQLQAHHFNQAIARQLAVLRPSGSR